MPEFTVEVIETRQYECTYTVEAPDRDTARERAAIGESAAEKERRFIGVTDRYTVGATEQLAD